MNRRIFDSGGRNGNLFPQMKLESLDHVAITVRDMERSAQWYCEVLGLERQHTEVWDDVPQFVGRGTTGIALFPLRDAESSLADKNPLRIPHFAFRTDRRNFLQAQRELRERGIDFHFEDHEIAHSIYFRDPDGHQLEITTYQVG